MTKADTMGASSAFSRAGTARSARGRAIDEALTSSAPTELALHLLGHNPQNPREALGDVSDLAASLRDHGQKQAVGIMTRDAFLRANPELEESLEPRCMYIVIDGNRRLAAAQEAGLGSLKVTLDDEFGGDSDEILESALVANIHRQAFEPLDEARALEQLLKVHQTQEALAARLHRSQGWVSQRLALLSLTPKLQKRLEQGAEPVVLLRKVGRKKPEVQEAELEALKQQQAQRQAERAAKKAKKKDTGSTKQQVSGENKPTPPSPEGNTRLQGQTKQDEGNTGGAVSLPWHDPTAILRILREHMSAADFEILVKEGLELL
ncbi:ParB/RepB/Spo0J family partition protein [Streptomyces sp. NPDC053048]|uniref:ParB/RepB/Spo0J family partition protein n=1 Tax=Streptomyces sp. NPDC053048 TaxID=3365694 RepID=UPI0037D37807